MTTIEYATCGLCYKDLRDRSWHLCRLRRISQTVTGRREKRRLEAEGSARRALGEVDHHVGGTPNDDWVTDLRRVKPTLARADATVTRIVEEIFDEIGPPPGWDQTGTDAPVSDGERQTMSNTERYVDWLLGSVVETRGDTTGRFVERWLVEPPAFGVTYRVLRDEWSHGDPPVRTVHEIEIVR